MEQKAPRPHPVQSTARLILDRIREVSAHFEVVSLNGDIDACENLFTQDQVIDVAILGQFKAGKSDEIRKTMGELRDRLEELGTGR
jgi:hypothetical protein